MTEGRAIASIVLGVICLIGGTIGAGMYGCPQYNVYSARLSGEATLAEAQSSRMAKVAEARARFESAQFDAQAEVARAKGTRDANNIVISSFGNTEERLRYLQIEALREGMKQGTVIYVPTNSLQPVLPVQK